MLHFVSWSLSRVSRLSRGEREKMVLEASLVEKNLKFFFLLGNHLIVQPLGRKMCLGFYFTNTIFPQSVLYVVKT